jgi:hypothetical protein
LAVLSVFWNIIFYKDRKEVEVLKTGRKTHVLKLVMLRHLTYSEDKILGIENFKRRRKIATPCFRQPQQCRQLHPAFDSHNNADSHILLSKAKIMQTATPCFRQPQQ